MGRLARVISPMLALASRRVLAVVFFLLVFAVAEVARSQDTSTSSADEEKQKLQDEKDKADLKKAIAQDNQAVAEAETATAKAKIGGISTDKLPQGNLTADEKMSIEGNILAYKTASTGVSSFAAQVAKLGPGGTCPQKITIYSPKEFNDAWAALTLIGQLQVIAAQAEALNKDITLLEEKNSGPRVAPAAIFAGIDAAVSLISLFKTDTTIKAVAITGDDSALQAALAEALLRVCPQLSLINPPYYQGAIVPVTQNGSLMYELNRIGTLAIALQARSADLEANAKAQESKRIQEIQSEGDKENKDLDALDKQIATLKAKLAKATSAPERKKLQEQIEVSKQSQTKLQERVRNLTAAKDVHNYNVSVINSRQESIKTFITGWEKFNADLAKTDDAGLTALQRMLRAESLQKQTADSDLIASHFVSAGGNIITSKNIFRSSLSFSGGSIVQLQYLDRSGAIRAAGVISSYGGRVREKDLPSGTP